MTPKMASQAGQLAGAIERVGRDRARAHRHLMAESRIPYYQIARSPAAIKKDREIAIAALVTRDVQANQQLLSIMSEKARLRYVEQTMEHFRSMDDRSLRAVSRRPRFPSRLSRVVQGGRRALARRRDLVQIAASRTK